MIGAATGYVGYRGMRSVRRSSSGEARRPLALPEKARLSPEARGSVALAVDEPRERRRGGSPAPQRDIGCTRPEDLSRTFRAGDREVTPANPALQRTGCAAAAGPLVVGRPV